MINLSKMKKQLKISGLNSDSDIETVLSMLTLVGEIK